MPEAAPHIHDSKDLESRVGHLLDDMQAGTQRLAAEAQAAPPPPAPAAALNAPESNETVEAELADAVAAMAAEQSAAIASAEGAAPANVPAVQPAVGAAAPGAMAADEPDLAAAVEKLLDESPAKPGAAPVAQNGKIDSLDAELAGLADELMAGEFADEAAVMKDERAPEARAPETTAPKAPAVMAAPPAEPVEPEAAKAPVPTPAVKPKPEPPTPREPADRAPVGAQAVAPKKVIAAAGATAGKRAAAVAKPLFLKVLEALSAPLQRRPHVRDALGWVALVQAFLALCVWVYVLFVRSNTPTDPPPVTPAKEVAEGEHSGGHGAQASKQGAAKKARKPAKKPSPAGASEGGHH